MIASATGALVDNSAIVICGGHSTRKIKQKKCYIFDKSNQWQLLGHMKTERVSAASVQVPNGLWVTGGASNHERWLDTTEIIFLNGTTTEGPKLPNKLNGHCLTEYNGTVYLIGGFDGSDDDLHTVLIFNRGKYICSQTHEHSMSSGL